MRGHVLYEMNLPFGPRFGFGTFRHGPFGHRHMGFGRPCGFEGFDGFGRNHRGNDHGHHRCEESSPERCGRGRHEGSGHSCEGRSRGPKRHQAHRSPGPHGHCCSGPSDGPCPPPYGPPGFHGPLHQPRPHGPHGPHGHQWPNPPPFGPFFQTEQFFGHGPCERRGGRKGESSDECCHKRHRKGSRGHDCSGDSDSSPERRGRSHRRCRSKSRHSPCRRGPCGKGPCDKRNKHQNTVNQRSTREGGATDAEEEGNQAPGILVQNIVVDNTPRSNSV